MAASGETLGNSSGETSGSRPPQVERDVERDAVLGDVAAHLHSLGVLKQAGVTVPGADLGSDPIGPPIASAEQATPTTQTEGKELPNDPQQRMLELLEANNAALARQNAELAEQNRLAAKAAKKQRKDAERERAQTAKHQATMEAAAREQVEAAAAIYQLNLQANTPELQRQAAAQQAAERASQEAEARREARPQWVKDLEGQLEQAASTGGDLGSIVISALINRGKTIRPHLPEPNPDNYGKDHFSYTILDPATGKPELIVKGQQTKRKWYGRKVTTEVTGPRRKTLIFTSKTRTPHAQDIGYNVAPVESIAIDRETGELYTCKGPNARLLDATAITRLYEAAGAAKPKKPQDFLWVAVNAMKLLSEGLNMLPTRQSTSRENTTHDSRGGWEVPPPSAYDEDDEPTIRLR